MATAAFALPLCISLRTPFRTRSHRPRRRYIPSARLPASVAAVKDRGSGAHVYVVGCVHGSKVSAEDVASVLDQTNPDAVILELCETRLKSLKQMMGNMPDKASEKRKPRTFEEVSKTFGGTGPAVIAFILESVYNLQILSGVQPGAEFYEAIRREGPWKIVCGDAPARDTIQNLYGVFGNPLRSLRDSLSSIEEIVGRLILPPKDGVTMLGLFLLEPRRVLELVRLTFPALVISSAISLAGNAGALALDSAPSIPISMLSEGYATTLLPIVASLGQTLTMSYIIVSTLRFMKVLIADRDRFLTKSILETASEIQSTHERPVVICAVVGLLHVNGIVRQIQGQSEADALAS